MLGKYSYTTNGYKLVVFEKRTICTRVQHRPDPGQTSVCTFEFFHFFLPVCFQFIEGKCRIASIDRTK